MRLALTSPRVQSGGVHYIVQGKGRAWQRTSRGIAFVLLADGQSCQ